MINFIRKSRLTRLTLIFPGSLFSSDNLTQLTETEKRSDISVVKNETGWERVQQMFQADEFGTLGPEVVTILNVGGMSVFMGAIYGGVIHSRVAYMDFIRNNQATTFTSHFEAKKKLQEKVFRSFGKGAWMWSWRLSLFTTSYVGISTTISVYRGKSGILDHLAAGLFTGALYKFNAGPRGWIVGGALGSALGLIAGCTTLALLSLTGMSMEEVRYWQYHWRQERQNYINQGMAEYLAKEEGEVFYQHDKKLGDKAKSLENLKT